MPQNDKCQLNFLSKTSQVCSHAPYLLDVVTDVKSFKESVAPGDHDISRQHLEGRGLPSTILAQQAEAFLLWHTYTNVVHGRECAILLEQVCKDQRV